VKVLGWLLASFEPPRKSILMSIVFTELSEPPCRYRGRLFLLAALFLLTVGIGLRVYHLGVRSLWLDEALTANISQGTWYDESFTGHFSPGSFREVLEQTRMWGSYPVAYPWMLYVVEKIGDSPLAVRAPSVLASILAILIMLAMTQVKVSSPAALFSGAILAVSVAQVRYAQEVREYSLSVLFAAILIFCFLQWEAASSKGRHPVYLYAALFIAPFVQYGLVLLSLGVLTTIGLLLLFRQNSRFKLPHGIISAASLGAGGLFSLVLTLRYQLGVRQFQSYLATNYFDSKTTGLLHFLIANSYGLMGLVFPGRSIILCFVICAGIFCVDQVRRRKCEPVSILFFTSVLITMGGSLARVYPYGGIRQCLFLAPVSALFAGTVFAELLERLRGSFQHAAVIGFLALIFLSGGRSIFKSSPYREIEDIRSVLKEVSRSSAPKDQVYVYPGAVPSVEFYLHGTDRRFVYGKDHRVDPQRYVPELLAEIDRRTDRIWLIFSHFYGSEEQGIVESLRPQWDVQGVIAPTGAALYVAHRRSPPVPGLQQQ